MPRLAADVCQPKLFQWDIADQTTPLDGKWPLPLRRLERQCAALVERYSVIESDVLLVGDDPLVLAIAARQLAVNRRSALILYVRSTTENPGKQNAAFTRPALFPNEARDMLRAVFPLLVNKGDGGLVEVSRAFMEDLCGFATAGGLPAVRLYAGRGLLEPHPGCLSPAGRQVLLRAPELPAPNSARPPNAYRVLAQELHKLPQVRFAPLRPLEMQIALVAHIVFVSECPNLTRGSWTVPVTRIAGASRPMEQYECFGPPERYMDLYEAVTLPDSLMRQGAAE